MEVKQVYELVNQATKEVIGETAVLQEDLSNVVDVGTAIFNANALDNYVKALVDRIGRTIFVTRPYVGRIPSVLMDSWEFGSVVQKISMELPEATENDTWNLEEGHSYDPNVFYKPIIEVKFFNGKTTFESAASITELQVKESFNTRDEMNSFVTMIFTTIENSMVVKIDALVMRVINNFIGETLANEYPLADYADRSGVRAVNLLKKYNDEVEPTTTLTADKALFDLDFIKYASREIKLYATRLESLTKIFNMGGKARHTTRDRLHIVLHDNFKTSADVYLQSDTFHNELTKLPESETVTHWQGIGTNFEFDETSKIHLKTSAGHEVEANGIIGIMFDTWALGVNNYNRRTKTNYVVKAEFFNYWFKEEAQYFNDFNENFVVFFIA